MIEIIEKTIWSFAMNSVKSGGMIGQVTKCKYNGVLFYVRENLKGVNSFYISSAERWGDKLGNSAPRKERQSLDLLAPKALWHKIADEVHQIDTLKRPGLKSVTFTWKWAAEQFS